MRKVLMILGLCISCSAFAEFTQRDNAVMELTIKKTHLCAIIRESYKDIAEAKDEGYTVAKAAEELFGADVPEARSSVEAVYKSYDEFKQDAAKKGRTPIRARYLSEQHEKCMIKAKDDIKAEIGKMQ